MAQRDDACTGESSEVNDVFSIEVRPGLPQPVREHEATFGVGVQHLDGLAREGGDDVPGSLGVGGGHVFGHAGDTDDLFVVADGSERFHRAKHGGGAAHVVLHLVHAGAGLDGNAPGVKGDAFAHKDGVRAALVSVEGEDHHARLSGRAHSNGHQAAHAESLGRFVFDDFHRYVAVLLGPSFGFLSEGHRVHVVGRAVAKVAGQVNTAGNASCTLDSRTQGFHIGLVAVDAGGQVGVIVIVVFALVLVVFVVPKHHALSESSDRCRVFGGEIHREFRAVDFLPSGHGGGTCIAVGVDGGIGFLAQTDEHGLASVRPEQRHRAVGFAFEVPLREHTVDLCLERIGDAFVGRTDGFRTFEDGQHQGAVDVVS